MRRRTLKSVKGSRKLFATCNCSKGEPFSRKYMTFDMLALWNDFTEEKHTCHNGNTRTIWHPDNLASGQPGTGQFCNWATYYLIKSFDSKSFKIAAIISVLLSWVLSCRLCLFARNCLFSDLGVNLPNHRSSKGKFVHYAILISLTLSLTISPKL